MNNELIDNDSDESAEFYTQFLDEYPIKIDDDLSRNVNFDVT